MLKSTDPDLKMEPISVDPKKLEEMLIYCLDFAKKMLSTQGEFHPFGAQIESSGKVGAVGAWNGEEYPKGQELAKILMDGFRKRFAEGEILAAALTANVNIPAQLSPPYPDGIRVTLECEGYARNIYLPYRIAKRRLLDKITNHSPQIEYANYISVDVAPCMKVQSI